MKKIITIAAAVAIGVAATAEQTPVPTPDTCGAMPLSTVMELTMAQYPQSTLKDIYKAFFQQHFGPEHLISNREASERYLDSELASMGGSRGVWIEPIGFRSGYVRVRLDAVIDSVVSREALVDALVASAKPVSAADVAAWSRQWHEIHRQLVEMGYDTIPGFAEDSAAIFSQLERGEYVGHHSEEYTRAYDPHYRVIAIRLLEGLFNERKRSRK